MIGHAMQSHPVPPPMTEALEPFVLDYTPGDEIIRTRVQNSWSPEIATRYFTALMPLMADQRARFGRAKVLADRRGGIPLDPETIATTISWYHKVYQPGDASAVVVDSSLLKVVLKKEYPGEPASLFISYEAAEMWLHSR